MHANRAEEILHAKESIGVQYRNNNVWIEKVDKERGIAVVTYLAEKNTVEVAIEQLAEVSR